MITSSHNLGALPLADAQRVQRRLPDRPRITRYTIRAKQLRLVAADPYLNEMLLEYCEQALAYRRSREGALRITIENAITPLLPHGKARLGTVAETLGVSAGPWRAGWRRKG